MAPPSFRSCVTAEAATSYLSKTLVPRSRYTDPFVISQGQLEDLERLTFFGVLEQPEYWKTTGSGIVNLSRRQTHDMGLGRWFTQPCLIIVGHLEDAPTPVPLLVDGTECETKGRTFVRWVYPLEPDPVIFDGIDDRPGRRNEG